VVGADGASERMRALAIMGIAGKGEFAVAFADAIRGANYREVAASVAADLKAKNDNINLINIIASGIDIAADQAIAGIESVFGPDVPIIGGTSGDSARLDVHPQQVADHILEELALDDDSVSQARLSRYELPPTGQLANWVRRYRAEDLAPAGPLSVARGWVFSSSCHHRHD
jgi:hypothetical protein